jgi:hypothetical protein
MYHIQQKIDLGFPDDLNRIGDLICFARGSRDVRQLLFCIELLDLGKTMFDLYQSDHGKLMDLRRLLINLTKGEGS